MSDNPRQLQRGCRRAVAVREVLTLPAVVRVQSRRGWWVAVLGMDDVSRWACRRCTACVGPDVALPVHGRRVSPMHMRVCSSHRAGQTTMTVIGTDRVRDRGWS